MSELSFDWTYLTSKFGKVPEKGWQIAFEIVEAAAKAGHKVTFLWGDGQTMDHKLNHTENRPVIDFMVENKAAGDWIRDYIWTHRKRHGLRHVIWWQQITSTVVNAGVVRAMADRGSTTANHKDHNHAEWFAGDYVAPDGSTTSQSSVDWKTERLDEDGKLGPKTISKWQAIVGTPVDGVISTPRSELIYWVQRYLADRVNHRLVADGKLGPKTIGALQVYLGTPVTQRFDSVTVKALQRRLNEGRF